MGWQSRYGVGVGVEWDEAVGGLRGVVVEVEGLISAAEIEMVWDLLEAGEAAAAFEMLCRQLSAHDVGLDWRTVERLADIGTVMKLKSRQWEILRLVE
jgi:hypothetical protein